MGQILVTDYSGTEQTLTYDDGDKLMEVLRDNGLVRAECGGMQICATCHVMLSPEAYQKTGPATDIEVEMLDGTGDYKADSSRLSCLIKLDANHDGIKLELGPEL
ncbi:2Fe-2S iron-sulfur cluster-binding protein [Kordiimonas aquimaris]|uniref:2Fe-2S iron-sulfur cluster-binding protein n=1 Tax=Kordiimonas aquimaris TaxID=707591 RepID=UPI0021D24FF2|nr:2Fe-2S iron-sulfur cluster-binding protein [Kordiimonas aquimaris]